jgi:hypothetical protein
VSQTTNQPPDEPAVRTAILEAAQQAWARGETLESWVGRYPAYALDLAALALSLARQQADPPLSAESVAQAAGALTRAMEGALGAAGDPLVGRDPPALGSAGEPG